MNKKTKIMLLKLKGHEFNFKHRYIKYDEDSNELIVVLGEGNVPNEEIRFVDLLKEYLTEDGLSRFETNYLNWWNEYKNARESTRFKLLRKAPRGFDTKSIKNLSFEEWLTKIYGLRVYE